jgi:hypothetical protein
LIVISLLKHLGQNNSMDKGLQHECLAIHSKAHHTHHQEIQVLTVLHHFIIMHTCHHHAHTQIMMPKLVLYQNIV